MNRFLSHLLVFAVTLTLTIAVSGCSDNTSSGSGSGDADAATAADAATDNQPDGTTTPDTAAETTDDPSTPDQTVDDVHVDTSQPDLEEDIDLDGFDCLNALFELLYVVGDSIDLEGTGGTCPAHEREGTGANQTITLTYEESCDWSGVITLATERTAVGEGDVTVGFDELILDDSAADGYMAGTYAITTGEVELSLTVNLDLTGTTACDITGTVDVSLFSTELTVDGTLIINTSEFFVETVSISYVELNSECPLPYTGRIIADPATGVAVSVTFDENSPVDGTVDMTVGPVDYDDMDYCAYW